MVKDQIPDCECSILMYYIGQLLILNRPHLRFGDYLSLTDDSESPEPKLILKRAAKDPTPMDKVGWFTTY